MDYNNLSKKQLVEVLENLKRILDGEDFREGTLFYDSINNQQSDLESLIGTIPFLLQNKDIFEKNQDIADFAKNLGVYIPSPEKKKKEDIIGRIIFAIAKFDSKRISELNVAIKSLKKSGMKKGKSNFFKDWENAIKEMKI